MSILYRTYAKLRRSGKHRISGHADFVKSAAVTYAIGEIILIFIGITLAMAFDNWNEDRKANKRAIIVRAEYIQSFYTSISNDVGTFQSWSESFEKQENWGRYVGYVLESESKIIEDSLRFINNYRDASLHIVVSQQPLTWNELVSRGNQELLQDDSLMNQLEVYYEDYNGFFENYFSVPYENRMALRSLNHKMFSIDENADYTDNDIFDGVPSRSTFEAIIAHKEVLGLIRSVVVSSGFQSRFLLDMVNNAEMILSYIERNYPKIVG